MNVSVAANVPPFSVIDAAVVEPGTAPMFKSVDIDSEPPVIVVPPEFVFVADNVNVPAPDLVMPTDPETTPETVADEPDAT